MGLPAREEGVDFLPSWVQASSFLSWVQTPSQQQDVLVHTQLIMTEVCQIRLFTATKLSRWLGGG